MLGSRYHVLYALYALCKNVFIQDLCFQKRVAKAASLRNFLNKATMVVYACCVCFQSFVCLSVFHAHVLISSENAFVVSKNAFVVKRKRFASSVSLPPSTHTLTPENKYMRQASL
jgi:hypothetical protein